MWVCLSDAVVYEIIDGFCINLSCVGGFSLRVSLFHSVPYEIIDGVCLNSAVCAEFSCVCV